MKKIVGSSPSTNVLQESKELIHSQETASPSYTLKGIKKAQTVVNVALPANVSYTISR